MFDEYGHLCFFDNGLIEKNALLYVSGYIKPVYDENSSPEGILIKAEQFFLL